MLVIARKIFFGAAAVFSLIGVWGCQMPAQPNGPTSVTMHISDREAFLDQTLTTLRSRDFAPEYVDRDQGLIITRPATSKQWFEFWRIDSLGAYQLAESSIHSVRRVVTVRCTPTDPEDPETSYLVTVQVDKERYSAPDRQITTASGAFAIYSERLPTTEGLAAARSDGEHWTPLGRDALLEDYLLNVIASAAPTPAEADALPPTPPDTVPAEAESENL